MVEGTQRASRRVLWVNLLALLLVTLAAAILLYYRNSARLRDGGLTMTLWRGERPGTDARPLLREVRPTVDLDAREGPRWLPAARSVRYEGWIYVPYRGHFVLALGVRGKARLDIGGAKPILGHSRPVLTEHGQRVHPRRIHKEQRLLDRGWHRLRLEAQLPQKTGSLRLYWMPPGRRGVPEYVEPQMLAPAGERPTAPGRVGPAPRDRWVAMALLLLAALLVAFWARTALRAWARRLTTDPLARLDFAWMLGLTAVALSLRLLDLSGAGQTWDEDVYFAAGRNQWLNLLSADIRALSWQWNLEHPPVTRYLVGLGALMGEHLGPARALSALAGALVAPVVYLTGRDLLRDRRVGVVAAVVVALLPALLAHSKVAGHESISVLLYSLTCYLVIRGLLVNGTRWTYLVAAAVAGGLLVGCRLVNITAWLFVVAVALMVALPLVRQKKPIPVALLLMPLVAGAVFVLSWPRLWTNPARHLGELLTFWHPDTEHAEYFLGRLIRKSWAYFPVYLLATTPTAVLCGLALFLARLGWRRDRATALMGLWILAPLAAAPLLPFHRDGIRYVLPAVVPLCLAAAVGALWLGDLLLSRLSGVGPRRLLSAGLCATALAVPIAWADVAIHPYYLDYYNYPSGGGEAALKLRRFEWSWWGEGLARSVRYLRRHAHHPAVVAMDVPARHTVVLDPDVKTTFPGSGPAPDFLLYAGDGLRKLWDQRAHRWRHPAGYRVVFEERAAGVVLSRVYERR